MFLSYSVAQVYLANLHLDIPPDLIDISGNQLQEQYGITEDEMMVSSLFCCI